MRIIAGISILLSTAWVTLAPAAPIDLAANGYQTVGSPVHTTTGIYFGPDDFLLTGPDFYDDDFLAPFTILGGDGTSVGSISFDFFSGLDDMFGSNVLVGQDTDLVQILFQVEGGSMPGVTAPYLLFSATSLDPLVWGLGSDPLGLFGPSTAGLGASVDATVIQVTRLGTVPVPAGLPMLAAGLGLLVLVRRRSRAA